jgi:epoxyqueuosine reductase
LKKKRLIRELKKNQNGQMSFMESHLDKRLNPTLLVDDAKSVVSLLLNYYPEQKTNDDSYKISKYAYGVDYHYVIKDKLKELLFRKPLRSFWSCFRRFCPVLDKAWAKSGLGWIGKNSNLLTKSWSLFFIAELIIDLDLDYDYAATDHCGTCTCIDACPRKLSSPYVVDSKCISLYYRS